MGRPKAECRSVLYAQHFLELIHPDAAEVRELAECLNDQHRYRETVSLLEPYITGKRQKWHNLLSPDYQLAQDQLAPMEP